MRQVRVDVNGDAVKADASPDANAERGNLVLNAKALCRTLHPYADTSLPQLTGDAELRQRLDNHTLQKLHKTPNVSSKSPLHVDEDIGNPLPRTVIGVLPPASGLENGKPLRVDEVGSLGTGTGRINRRMLQEPDHLSRSSSGDGIGARLHGLHREGIFDGSGADHPFDNAAIVLARDSLHQFLGLFAKQNACVTANLRCDDPCPRMGPCHPPSHLLAATSSNVMQVLSPQTVGGGSRVQCGTLRSWRNW